MIVEQADITFPTWQQCISCRSRHRNKYLGTWEDRAVDLTKQIDWVDIRYFTRTIYHSRIITVTVRTSQNSIILNLAERKKEQDPGRRCNEQENL